MDNRARGHLAALFTVLIWATTFIATKLLLRDFTPVEILVFRFTLGVAALYAGCPRLLRVRDVRQELTFAAAGLTGACLYYMLENLALTCTTAANVGIIAASSPLFTALFAWAAGGGRPGGRFFLGFLTAISGICLLSLPELAGGSLHLRGDLLALGGAVVWGVYSNLVKRISAFGYPVLQTTRRTFLYGLAFMFPACGLTEFRLGLERFSNPGYLAAFLYLGVGACAVCFVTWGTAVKILGPVKTSVYIYISPAITLLCSVLILHEHVTLWSLAGAALTLVGLVLSQWDSLKQRRG